MTAHVIVGLAGDEAGHDDLFSLLDHLADEEELADAVAHLPGEVQPGTLGNNLGTLLLTLGSSGGAVAAVARVLTTWLRTRKGNLTIKVTRRDGSSFSVAGVSRSPEHDDRLLQELREFLDTDSSDDPS
ncbi:effector-associated constant component EACC1 [Streptomyces sp. NPDC002144]